MAELLKGKPVADALNEVLLPQIEDLKSKGITPTLAFVRVGEREDDLAYERGATKRCETLGIERKYYVLESDCSQEELLSVIESINKDPGIHGCLLFRPLPKHLDEAAACAALDPAKDVDGITETSLFGVFANQPKGFPPCTADACMQVLRHYGYEVSGANVAVVGRSLVIGKPLSMMLQAANATVTMCHTRTRDLPGVCKNADILVVAAGHIGTIQAAAVREDQVVIDVGMNWDEAASKFVGDVVFDEVEPLVKAITPVPGGVGSVTTAVLASHVVKAAQRAQEQ
ncbi:MAG: bifunctional 5,10-methylenetetrahydrofolate dehydrogenase/5,10-methenyltetrahydrofolate cyclohydrolase [Coriobacteriales bacterium]|nr:bifunctional 5,10-methylenetetrahydrofolate dehydrogenase/5,10-methenyltetrahydrofolate cyclohydrolase [Coriobacteriales bacterium]